MIAAMREIIIATGNKNKVCEFGEIMKPYGVSLSSLADHWDPVPSIPETGETFQENALLKAQWVFDRKKKWVLADDSGLEVDALGGRPGVRSARFAGDNADGEANNRLLLDLLADIAPENRTARFKCALVLVTSAGSYFTAIGICEGIIVQRPRGNRGFGYDPLFMPVDHAKTFAELDAAEKHAISHRGRAIGKMRNYLDEFIGQTGNS
jgi:XTP/dITP diphosphohydrolase